MNKKILRKRVLQVFSSLDKGGAETRMMQIYRKINREEWQFDFAVTTPGEHFYSDEVRSLGGNIFYLRSWREVGIRNYMGQWDQIFAQHAYEAVHAHTTEDCGIALYFAKRAGIQRRIAHARNAQVALAPNWRQRSKKRIMKALTRHMANKWVACSKEAAEYLYGRKAIQQGRVIFLPNAIDLEPFQQLSCMDKEAYREKLGLGNTNIIVGTVGNARPVKNHPFLIRAFAEFLKLQPHAMLLMIGRNDQDQEAKQLVQKLHIEQKVLFLGQREDVPQLLNCLDLFVLPSFHEGAPGSVIEAQAANLPCILSDSLTREVDLGNGLVKYLSLDMQLGQWAKEMEKSCKMKRPEIETTWNLLRAKHYDVESSVHAMIGLYR